MLFRSAPARWALVWTLALGAAALGAPSAANVNPPAAIAKNPPAELATMAPAQSTPEFECYHYAELASGEGSANAPAGYRLLPDAVGGAAIGAVAGSLSGKAGRGAALGALAGALLGGLADASASAAWQRRHAQHDAAYAKCMSGQR